MEPGEFGVDLLGIGAPDVDVREGRPLVGDLPRRDDDCLALVVALRALASERLGLLLHENAR